MGEISEDVATYLSTGITAADLDRIDYPPMAWAVPGVIPEGLTMLAGAPKTGKSWLALSTALGIASGGVALGRIKVGEPRPVLYFALEDGHRRLQQRTRDLLGGEEPPELLSFHVDVPPGMLRPSVEGWLTQNPTGLVILDTLGRVRPAPRPNETQYGADYAVMAALKKLTDDRPGSSFVVVHHTRKQASADVFDTVSGTTGLTGAVDTTLVLTRPRGEDEGVLEVTGRDVPEGSYALVNHHPGSWQINGRDLAEAASRAAQVKATEGLGDKSADILAFVHQHGGVRAGQVEEAFGPDARRYLSRLADSGRLQRPKRGLYTPVPSVPVSQEQGLPSQVPMGQRDTCDTPPLEGA